MYADYLWLIYSFLSQGAYACLTGLHVGFLSLYLCLRRTCKLARFGLNLNMERLYIF